jgi:hypothetical protein
MARQRTRPKPHIKHMEAYKNFSGGLNTVTSNDNLKDSEATDLINVDLGDRGSLKRRFGMLQHLASPVLGGGQGYFRYYKADGTFEEIIAVAGKLYKGGLELTITGLASFQTTRQVEAVQYKSSLYIATGTELVEYDGTSAKVVVPHKTAPLEYQYIGGNGLADDPKSHFVDGTGTVLVLDAVIVDKRYGVINKASTFSAYVTKPSTMTVAYRYEYRKVDETTWVLGRDYATDRTWAFTPTETTDYEVRCLAKENGTTNTPVEYYMPKYTVKSTDDNQEVSTSTLGSCNRILLHWERLVLYGDTTQGEAIYVSHLKNPRYFPIPNSLLFDNEKKEDLSSLVQYRDMIVAFTETTIQALYGKNPIGLDPYRRVMLNTTVGCIAPQSAKVMGNYIAFLAKEGVHILKSVGYTENRLNVEKIDTRIDNLITSDEDACGVVFSNQYHILFPQKRKRFRYYYEQQGVWTKDESDKLDFARFYDFEGSLYGQSSTNGNILRFDENTWTDDGLAYDDVMELKFFDFREPYNPKKLKEIQVLMARLARTNVELYVYADSAIVLSPDTSEATVDANGNIVWVVSTDPNIKIDTGTTFGAWKLGESAWGNIDSEVYKLKVAGRCRRMKMKLAHKEATPNQFLGFATIFKLKSP